MQRREGERGTQQGVGQLLIELGVWQSKLAIVPHSESSGSCRSPVLVGVVVVAVVSGCGQGRGIVCRRESELGACAN